MAVDWTDELREKVVAEYLASNPTAENGMEIAKKIAEGMDCTANAVRGILSRAVDGDGKKVYIPKVAGASTAKAGGETKDKKETKQESIDRLKAMLTGLEVTLDDALIDRMTGKAAAYFADAFKDVNGDPEND